MHLQARWASRCRSGPPNANTAHNLPVYVIYGIFLDATLAAIAARNPGTLDDLQGNRGMGAKKLEAYGPEVLWVCMSA